MRRSTELNHIAGTQSKLRAFLASRALLAALVLISAGINVLSPAPSFSQGLHIPPDGFSGTWDDYVQQEKQTTQGVQNQLPLWGTLHQFGIGKVVSQISYGQRLKQQAWQWHRLDEFAKAEECHRKSIAVAENARELIELTEDYGGFLEARQRYSEEVQIRLRVLLLSEKLYGKDDAWVAHKLKYLAEAHGRVARRERERGGGKKVTEAATSTHLAARSAQLACYRRALEILRHSSATMDIYDYYPDTVRDLALVLDEDGAVAESEITFKQALAWRMNHDNSSSQKIGLAWDFAEFYIRHKRPQAAEPLLKQILAMWNKDPHEYNNTYSVIPALEAYSRILSGTNRNAEAQKMIAIAGTIKKQFRF